MNEAELKTQIERVLADYPDPETGAGLFGTGQARKLSVENGAVRFDLALTTHAAPLWRETLDALQLRAGDRLCLLGGLGDLVAPRLSSRFQPVLHKPLQDALGGAVQMALRLFAPGAAKAVSHG